jgi:hypothetical protein
MELSELTVPSLPITVDVTNASCADSDLFNVRQRRLRSGVSLENQHNHPSQSVVKSMSKPLTLFYASTSDGKLEVKLRLASASFIAGIKSVSMRTLIT